MRRLFEGGVYSRAAFIRRNTVYQIWPFSAVIDQYVGTNAILDSSVTRVVLKCLLWGKKIKNIRNENLLTNPSARSITVIYKRD